MCLRADRGFLTTFEALVFDRDLEITERIGLAGTPSRVRVAPGGELAAATVFVTGHSYADAGFSTQTTLIDLDDGDVIADLEVDFTVERNGETWREIDFNFWGVTFVDDDRFYATLGTGGDAHLVEGGIAARRMRVLEPDVECPSLAPDGTRLAFKRRGETANGAARWRIGVLDLTTREVTILAEERSVDDQVAWLDDETVMYGLPVSESPAETDTWIVPADGTGAPRLHVERAWSTATT